MKYTFWDIVLNSYKTYRKRKKVLWIFCEGNWLFYTDSELKHYEEVCPGTTESLKSKYRNEDYRIST